MMKQLLADALVAMILSCSSIAIAARVLHRDVFAERDPKIAIIWVLLGLLYLIGMEWINRRQNVKKMVRG